MATGLFTLKQVNQALGQKAWSGTQKTNFVQYLVVAGGGSGGGTLAGGGGGGGLLTGIASVTAGTSYTVTVGAGGAAKTSTSGQSTGNSGINSVFGSISSSGGGGGGSYINSGTNDAVSGGSGGGGASADSVLLSGANGIVGQGNAGGAGKKGVSPWASGGGGGAGTVGLAAYGGYAGNGGAGIASAISGTVTVYAGGGGGGVETGTIYGTGGVGGGGNGASSSSTTTNNTAGSGTTNTGGGGGGGAFNTGVTSGAGGSGIVIVSYPDVYAAATSTTGSPTVSTSGSGSLLFASPNNLNTIGTTSSWTFMSNTSALFTIEAWIYPTSTSSMTIIDTCAGGSANTGTFLGIDFTSNSKLHLLIGRGTSGAVIDAVSTGTISLNTWTHVAVTYDQSLGSNNASFYINGVLSGQTSKSANTPSSGNTTYSMVVGNANGSGVGYVGYLSNLRIVNSVVYSAAFTVPKTPLSAISNTQYLLNTNSTFPFYDSSSNRYVATVTSIPSWNSLSPFTGTGASNRVYTWTSSGSITF